MCERRTAQLWDDISQNFGKSANLVLESLFRHMRMCAHQSMGPDATDSERPANRQTDMPHVTLKSEFSHNSRNYKPEQKMRSAVVGPEGCSGLRCSPYHVDPFLWVLQD
eukprot:4239254-Amphidinium_carterae.1